MSHLWALVKSAAGGCNTKSDLQQPTTHTRNTSSPITGTAPLARFTALLMTVNRLPFIFNQSLVRLNFSVTRYLDTIKLSSGLFCSLEKQNPQKFGIDFIVVFCSWFVQSSLIGTFWHEIRLNKIFVSVQLHVDSVIYSVYCQCLTLAVNSLQDKTLTE